MIRLPSTAPDTGLLLAQGAAALALLLMCAPSVRAALRFYAGQGALVAADVVWHAWGGMRMPAMAAAALLAVVLVATPAILSRRFGQVHAAMASPGLAGTALHRFALGAAVIGGIALLMPAMPGVGDELSREHLIFVVATAVLGLLAVATCRPAAVRGIGLLSMVNGTALAAVGVAGVPSLMCLCAASLVLGGAAVLRSVLPNGRPGEQSGGRPGWL